jgi:hypothetical protein
MVKEILSQRLLLYVIVKEVKELQTATLTLGIIVCIVNVVKETSTRDFKTGWYGKRGKGNFS